MPATARTRGDMSEQRRARLRLEISREAARLFWAQGVAGTSGDQIAEAVGLSTRTIWRHFRSKEACAEPIVRQGVETLLGILRHWPRETSLEDHLKAELVKRRLEFEDVPEARAELADEMLALKMVRLADTEPALRTAWLMAYDQVEHEMRAIIGDRLRRPADDLEVRLHAATASAALRVLDEHIGADILAGGDLTAYDDLTALSGRLAGAIRTATGGVVGDALT
jgi:AcrR family transcriptional regulator